MKNTCFPMRTSRWLTLAFALAFFVGQRGVAQDAGGPLGGPQAAAPADSNQKFGEAPEDHSLEFLRDQSIMLKEGQWQFDVGLNYTIPDHNFTQFAYSGGTAISNLFPLDSRDAAS